jgi:hypothetical protein
MARTQRRVRKIQNETGRKPSIPALGVIQYHGEGFHSPNKYTKNDRRKSRQDLRQGRYE